MANKLKPCMFCKSTDISVYECFGSDKGYHAHCEGCGAEGPLAPYSSTASDKWNDVPREDEVVELPKDADGVPIRVGETVYGKNYGTELIVMSLCLSNAPWTANCCDSAGTHCTEFPQSLTHVKPDNLESIEKDIRELAGRAERKAPVELEIISIMERIEKLIKRASK